jgi:hypothetical protein
MAARPVRSQPSDSVGLPGSWIDQLTACAGSAEASSKWTRASQSAGRIQVVVATTSANFSAGVFHPSVFRGLPLS